MEITSQCKADNGTCPKNQTRPIGDWLDVTGDEHFGELKGEWRPFNSGCRSTDTVVIHVPKRLVNIGISVAKFGSQSYITGIRLTAEGSPEIRAGYISNRGEVIQTLTRLHGFRVAVGAGGVRDLQVVGRERYPSWIVCTKDVPFSERLVSSESIEAIKVMVDASEHRRPVKVNTLIVLLGL